VCFSDSGERPGQWQIAAVVAVVVLVAMPCCLAIYMSRATLKPETSLNVFDKSAFSTYFDAYNSSNRHWFTVMYATCPCFAPSLPLTALPRFYHRIVLSVVIFYTVGLSAPFIRGILAWFVCMAILVLDIE
jgi:hypothetical protein